MEGGNATGVRQSSMLGFYGERVCRRRNQPCSLWEAQQAQLLSYQCICKVYIKFIITPSIVFLYIWSLISWIYSYSSDYPNDSYHTIPRKERPASSAPYLCSIQPSIKDAPKPGVAAMGLANWWLFGEFWWCLTNSDDFWWITIRLENKSFEKFRFIIHHNSTWKRTVFQFWAVNHS